MGAVNTALSVQGRLRPDRGQLQVPALNPLLLPRGWDGDICALILLP